MTKVIFRKVKNPYIKDWDIMAFFPDTLDSDYRVTTYEHMGQHGYADLLFYYDTKKATPEEYADLYRELTELVGYEDLKVFQRWNR